jgi:hypothetical protein
LSTAIDGLSASAVDPDSTPRAGIVHGDAAFGRVATNTSRRGLSSAASM